MKLFFIIKIGAFIKSSICSNTTNIFTDCVRFFNKCCILLICNISSVVRTESDNYIFLFNTWIKRWKIVFCKLRKSIIKRHCNYIDCFFCIFFNLVLKSILVCTSFYYLWMNPFCQKLGNLNKTSRGFCQMNYNISRVEWCIVQVKIFNNFIVFKKRTIYEWVMYNKVVIVNYPSDFFPQSIFNQIYLIAKVIKFLIKP